MEAAATPDPRSRRLLGLLGLTYLTRLVAGSLVTLPIAAAVRASGLGHQPTSDAVLFAPGATYLFETVRLGSAALGAALPVSSVLFMAALLLQIVPQGALIHSLTRPSETVTTSVQRSLTSFSRFVLLGGLGFLAQACASGLGLMVAQGVQRAVGGTERPWSGEIAWLLVVMVSALSVCCIGALVDLARCAHVLSEPSDRPPSSAACIRRALHTLLRHPWRGVAALLVPIFVVVTLAVGVGFAVGALQVERGETWRWLTILVLHQGVILACCAAELYWLSRATRLVHLVRHDDPCSASMPEVAY
jgi:hypothetical protein